VTAGDDLVADVHDETAVQEANCPGPEPEIDPAQHIMALREAHDAAAAALCEALTTWQGAIDGHAKSLEGSQLAYQSGRSDGRSEMARECITDIDGRMAAMKAGTLAHQALSAHREAMLRKVLP
jgi:hypothetical protein